MHLIVMRHGEAGWHSLDQERELTEAGRRGVAAVAALACISYFKR